MIETVSLIPPNVLVTSRIIWATMIIGQFFFAGVIAFMFSSGSLKPQLFPIDMLMLVDAMLLVFGVSAGWLIGRVMSKPTVDEGTAIRRFQTVNIIRMALLEGPSFFGLVMVLLSAKWLPGVVVPVVCVCLQVLRFPRSTI